MSPDEWERRIYDMLDGGHSAREREEFMEEIVRDPAALDLYRRCCEVDSALQRLAMGQAWLAGPGISRREEHRGRPRHGLLYGSLAAAALILLGLGIVLRMGHVPPAEPAYALTLGAYAVHTVSSILPEGATERAGEGLREGSILELEQGEAELGFPNGVRAVLRAPARLLLDRPDQVSLARGHAWFSVPPSVKGFRVLTPDLDVLDLGTAFGVVREPGRLDEVHVFTGKVLARHRAAASGQAGEELRGGEARLASPRRLLERIEAGAEAFRTEVAAAPMVLSWSFDRPEGGEFPATGNHPDRAMAMAVSSGILRRVDGLSGGLALAMEPEDRLVTRWTGILGSHPRTVCAWVRVPEDVDDREIPVRLVYWGREEDDLASEKWRVGLHAERLREGGVKGALRTEHGYGWVLGSTDLRDGRWHHIASVFQGGNDEDNTERIKLYVDGRLEAVSASQHHLIDTRPGMTLRVGGEGRFDIARLTIMDHAVSEEEIARLASEHTPSE
jgi:hypothetical protein